MKAVKVLAMILFSISKLANAQYAIQNNPLNITGSSSILKTEIPLAAPSIVGSTYLDDAWQNARIILRGGAVIENCPIRVEIERVNVEIQFKGEIKFLNLSKVDFINTKDVHGKPTTIRSAKQYTLNDVPLEGIVSVEHSGEEYAVIKHFYIEVLLANYNIAMDVGSKDHRIIKKERMYISRSNKLFAVKGSNKKLIGKLGLDKKRTRELIKKKELNLSNEADLITFVKLLETEG